MKKNPGFVEKKEINLEEEKNSTENKIFLYNPWEKSEGINYYWTNNSYQKIYVELYNPLIIKIDIIDLEILFEGKKPFSIPGIKKFFIF